MRHCLSIGTLFLGLYVGAEVAAAEKNSVGAKAIEGLGTRPTVSVRVYQPSTTLTAPFEVRVHVINLTDHDLELDKVRVFPPLELLDARNLGKWKEGELEVQNATLYSGHQRDFIFDFPRDDGFALLRRPRLTFAPGDYDLRASVSYSLAGAPAASNVEEIVSMRLEPPIGSIFVGGIIGALLVSVFLGVRDYQTHRVTKSALGKALYLGVAGSVCVCMAIIIMDRVKSLNLPVEVTVTDFYGAVVVGLFSPKVSDWLTRQLLPKNEREDAARTA